MTAWHVDDQLVQRYASGGLSGPLAASLEAHVTSCRPCQLAVAQHAPAARLQGIWTDLSDRIDAPRPRPLERVLRLVGVGDSDALLVARAPALRLAWVLSLATVLMFSVAASASPRVGPDVFLLLAPVLPVLSVGLSYGPWTDPSYEMAQSAPYSVERLILLRTGLVLTVTVTLAAAAGALLPRPGTAVIWLLPSAALVATTLAVAAWIPLITSALVISGGWAVAVGGVWTRGSFDSMFGVGAQEVSLGLAAFGILAVLRAHRAQAYELRRFK